MPAASSSNVRYLVFDTESVTDGTLVSRLRYPGEGLTPQQAIAKYRGELMEKFDSDFVPYTFQLPVSVAVAKVGSDLRIIDLVTLDEPKYRPHVICENFWRGWEKYRKPTLISFNGRTFDLPLMELAAFRFGLPLPQWFAVTAKSFEQPRNRFNQQAHFDLQELLTNFGATRLTGGLNLVANLIGKPGKMDVQGHMVQDMYDAGKIAEINDYCRCDVLDTYFVFLRCQVLLGQLSLDEEQGIIAETKTWLIKRSDQTPAYQEYLSRWGDWANPWGM
ncbi:MAG: 3'-5' exonuclease [Planctomycetes bacterium]|nr:3'-5' exonuclease [Planctomycetota bacterium]